MKDVCGLCELARNTFELLIPRKLKGTVKEYIFPGENSPGHKRERGTQTEQDSRTTRLPKLAGPCWTPKELHLATILLSHCTAEMV